MFNLVERDGNVLYIASLLVLSVMLLVIFRNLRWVLASVGIVIASVALTRAMLVIWGAQLSMVSSMLNSLVTVISIGTTTHIIVYYRELRATCDQHEATDSYAAGFMASRDVDSDHDRRRICRAARVRHHSCSQFCHYDDARHTDGACCFNRRAARRRLHPEMCPFPAASAWKNRLTDFLTGWHTRLTAIRSPQQSGAWCSRLVTAPGLFIMQVETDFSKNFRESSPIVQSLKFVESNLGPAGSWDVAFDVPDPVTNDFLDSTRELTDRLQELTEEGIKLNVLSLNDGIDIPPRFGSTLKRLNTFTNKQPDLVAGFYNPDRHRMRIVLHSTEQQPTHLKLAQIERVRDVVANHFDKQHAIETERTHAALVASGSAITSSISAPPKESASATGLFVLMAHIIDSLLADQIRSFMVASLGTVICMWIAFRSLRIGLISLVPNVFPIALVTGSLGLLNVPVNIGTAMIASVAMGFTASVHYVAVFQKSLPEVGVTRALQIAQSGVGVAVVLAHIALVAGFMVLTVSEFIPLVYFARC